MSSEQEPLTTSAAGAAAATPLYYDKGSVELAVETPVMMQRLEKRRQLTLTGVANTGAERLLIVLVGLPARGKSFIARKLLNYLTWRGNQCRIFNVGKYRRQAAAELRRVDDSSSSNSNCNTTDTGTATEESPSEPLFAEGGNNEASPERFGCDANFFDESNHEAARLRQKVAEVALKDTLEWLEGTDRTNNNNRDPKHGSSSGSPDDASSAASSSMRSVKGDLVEDTFSTASSTKSDLSIDDDMYFTSGHESHGARRQFHRIAIFDATNSTRERRQWILTECAKASTAGGSNHTNRTGVLFLESICDDKELLAENHKFKISSSPDFVGMTEDEALRDLEARIKQYEARYETIDDHHQSYIKVFNLSSRLMVNHIYGRLAKVVLPAIMAWNTGSRPVFLCRAAGTKAMEAYTKESQVPDSKKDGASSTTTTARLRSDRLGERGLQFRAALCKFVEQEGVEFMKRKNKNVIHPGKMDTGTSISGLYEERDRSFETVSSDPFPCLVMSSTMPRAVETATWRHAFPVKDVSNLNPLDMGDFAGMHLAQIEERYPEWYEQLKREPFHTRFPGGESYSDLIDRLYSIVIDMEQQLGLAVVVGHVSTLQVLVSYFRSSPVSECMNIEVPMNTVLKFEPLRGGGWLESQHKLLPDDCQPQSRKEAESEGLPLWGDSSACLPTIL